LASREKDGALQLRVPLTRRSGPNGDVFEFGAADQSALDPAPGASSRVTPGNRVPKLASAESVSVRDMLARKPEGTGIDYDQPAEDEIDQCRVVLESGEAWTLLDRNLVLLRRFVDKNHDGTVDLWVYCKSGKEVWRDVDTDYDGKVDRSEGVEIGKGVQSGGRGSGGTSGR
jgi:hypothetical protein